VLIAALYHADQSFHEKTKIFSMRTEHDFCTLIREQNIWQKSSKKAKNKKVSLKTARL
jgi:predicted acetyltransferase